MKTAVIYARVSSSNDRQDTSRQIEDLKKYAILQDIEIVNIFQEHISGAKKIEERQILGECLEYCKRESVNILLLYSSFFLSSVLVEPVFLPSLPPLAI